MDFTHDTTTVELRQRLVAFMEEHVLPAEPVLHDELTADPARWGAGPAMADLKRRAREAGLWNLFLSGTHSEGGLSNVQYAPLAEVMGWSPHVAPEAFNCAAPDTGNMELLSHFGTPEQQKTWLEPLLAGDIRSCFSMTEPDVASSDATNIRTRIELDGDEWVINGRKWWSTGALRPECRVALVMGVTDPDAERNAQQSIVLVPTDTPGLSILRSTSVLGFDDRHEGGHGELLFEDVRVPAANLLGDRGQGFAVAQVRLGPGRIHHCMRLIGMAERAVALMVRRAQDRQAFGGPLIDQGVIQQWIADARIGIEAARLLVMRAAAHMDAADQKAARSDISIAKVFVPATVKTIIDHAIQVHGAMGLSQDSPLAMLYSQARFLQIADGPDEVHRRTLARLECRRRPPMRP
jgi:acyl-CoA dehydrogenase